MKKIILTIALAFTCFNTAGASSFTSSCDFTTLQASGHVMRQLVNQYITSNTSSDYCQTADDCTTIRHIGTSVCGYGTLVGQIGLTAFELLNDNEEYKRLQAIHDRASFGCPVPACVVPEPVPSSVECYQNKCVRVQVTF